MSENSCKVFNQAFWMHIFLLYPKIPRRRESPCFNDLIFCCKRWKNFLKGCRRDESFQTWEMEKNRTAFPFWLSFFQTWFALFPYHKQRTQAWMTMQVPSWKKGAGNNVLSNVSHLRLFLKVEVEYVANGFLVRWLFFITLSCIQ